MVIKKVKISSSKLNPEAVKGTVLVIIGIAAIGDLVFIQRKGNL